MLLAFVFLYFFVYTDEKIWMLIIFGVAAVTDAIDGWLARKLDITSKFGKNFDPLADKFLTTAAFLAFYWKDIIPFLWVAILIGRDVINTVLRGTIFRKKHIATSVTAKIKTAFQFIFIFSVLLLNVVAPAFLSSIWLDYAVAALAIFSTYTLVEYLYKIMKKS